MAYFQMRPIIPLHVNVHHLKINIYLIYIKNVFKCWWGIGNDVYKINKENEELVDSLWKKRQTLNINQCRLCNYRYLCGGGCVGRNMHNNTISCQKGECHNFKEILEIAIKEEYNDRI